MCLIIWSSSVSQWLDNCGQGIKRLSECEYSQMTVCFFNSENTTLADIMLVSTVSHAVTPAEVDHDHSDSLLWAASSDQSSADSRVVNISSRRS